MNENISGYDNETDRCDRVGLGGQGANSDWVVREGQAGVPATRKSSGCNSVSKSGGEMRPEARRGEVTAWTEVVAGEVQRSTFGGELGGRANRT